MNDLEVQASPDMLVDQAGRTADRYLAHAIVDIDHRLGNGYAKQHPELIAAVMQTAARDFHSAMLKAAAQDIRDALRRIAEAMENAERTLSEFTATR